MNVFLLFATTLTPDSVFVAQRESAQLKKKIKLFIVFFPVKLTRQAKLNFFPVA